MVGNRTLTDLDLSDAKLHGIAPLARVLAATALSTFSIALNDIGDGGALLIAETLKDNTVLKHIDLEANHIGPEGGVAIAEALRGNAVLKSIKLRYNNLGDEGEGAIRDAVSGRVGFMLENHAHATTNVENTQKTKQRQGSTDNGRGRKRKERTKTDNPREDGRTARRHHTGILRRGVWC